jgi:3-phenylpropionate/trans-cinnamate dioxygenase ferredoxin subunit
MTRFVVARVDEIAPGDRKIVDVAGRSIGVYNVAGAFYALRNRCPHQGGPLCQGATYGVLESSVPGEYIYSRPGEMVRCPWHGWEFDIKTGQSWFDPAKTRVRSYAVVVASGQELEASEIADPASGLEKGPFMAETYPASADGEFVVVEIEGV